MCAGGRPHPCTRARQYASRQRRRRLAVSPLLAVSSRRGNLHATTHRVARGGPVPGPAPPVRRRRGHVRRSKVRRSELTRTPPRVRYRSTSTALSVGRTPRYNTGRPQWVVLPQARLGRRSPSFTIVGRRPPRLTENRHSGSSPRAQSASLPGSAGRPRGLLSPPRSRENTRPQHILNPLQILVSLTCRLR